MTPDPGASAAPRRIAQVTFLLLLAGASELRFLFLDRKPFWFDECFSAEMARLPWHDFFRLLWWREANMSLYYLLLRGWMHFGASPFFIRSLSALISIATLPAIYWLASRLYDRRTGIIAVALMSVSAYHVRYAQEARSYALLVLLASLSSGFFVAMLRNGSRRSERFYVLASILAVYAHLYALLLVGAQWATARRLNLGIEGAQQPVILRLRRAWIFIAVGVAPLLIFAAKTGAGPIRWIVRPGPHELLSFAESLAGNDGVLLLLFYAIAVIAAGWPVRSQLFQQPASWSVWRVQFLAIWLLGPIILIFLLSFARPLFLGRYFIFCLPALMTLVAAGIASLSRPWMVAICLVVLMGYSLQGTLHYYDHDFDLQRDDSRAAATYILDHARPGDALVFHIAEARLPYEYFKSLRANDPRVPEVIFPKHGDRLDYRDVTGKPSSDFLRSLPSQYGRVWVVLMSNTSGGHDDATTLMINSALGETFRQIAGLQYSQVNVELYERK